LSFEVSDQRKSAIYADIQQGCNLRFNYYVLLLLSALIAAFGLIADSPAVVIGAMLISPLMTPIFGISISLVSGDTVLLRQSLLAEAGGIILAVLASFILGISPLTFEMTQEILNRTSPNLLDLFVALLAGFAGCMAMIDERINPILPGIAISTSLTPPLAACGLCCALGAFEGGMGAFILFFANFVTILLVASITFMAAGFIKGRFGEHRNALFKRFFLAAVSMCFLILFLTHALIRLIEIKNAQKSIRHAVMTELSGIQNINIKEIIVDKSKSGKGMNALVIVDAPREPSPSHIKAIETSLERETGKSINILMQTRITKSVSSSRNQLINFYRSADGIEKIHRPGKDVQQLNLADQIIRERLEQIPGMTVAGTELRYGEKGEKIIYTTVQGIIRPFPDGIKKIENDLRVQLNEPDLRLISRYIESYEVTADGINASTAPDVDFSANRVTQLAGKIIREKTGLIPQSIKTVRDKDNWIIVAEITGLTVMTQEQADAIKQQLQNEISANVRFQAYSKAEAMMDAK
jgi:uncharacterized hydrophobic protein (TIGR00271 family)